MERFDNGNMYMPTEIRPTILRGKRYTLIGPVTYSFHDTVPDWYLNTLTFWVEGDVTGTEFKVLVDEQ